MQSAKKKIKNAVDKYIEFFPDEYLMFLEVIRTRRHTLSDEKFGQANDSHNEMRGLFEIPVTLHEMIVNTLSEEELTWFKSGGTDQKQGARWFATTFPIFRLPEAV